MAMNKNNYKCNELINHIAIQHVSLERLERLKQHINNFSNVLLPGHSYGDLVLVDNSQERLFRYLDYLQQINIIQKDSHLLSFPQEIVNRINKIFVKNRKEISMPPIYEFPIIITGELPVINKDCGDIKLNKEANNNREDSNKEQIKEEIDFEWEDDDDENENEYDWKIVEEIESEEKIESSCGIIDIFGAYFPVFNIIVIDVKKITKIANSIIWKKGNFFHLNFSALYELVLRHEIGHWISHEMLINSKHLNDELYINLPTEIHEFWAQIIAYKLLSSNRINQRFMDFFADQQPKEYQTYKDFKHLSDKGLSKLFLKRNEITSIDKLRNLLK
jgi:hypothetical protein